MGSSDFNPGPWKEIDFSDARAHYDKHIDRSYGDARATGKTIKDVRIAAVRTESGAVLIVVTDQTGSMGDWTAVMFGKLGYLEIEAKNYLGEDLEICFAAFGDASNPARENYPLQVRPFDKGTNLVERLKELVIEQKGGGSFHESSELAALYFARKCEMPNAVHPVIIFISDEMPYDAVDPDQAKEFVGVTFQGPLPTSEVFRELKRNAAVYFIQKPYGEGHDPDITNEVRRTWTKLVGQDHMAELSEAQRVVDVIFGILAQETGKRDRFMKEIADRQTPDQVQTVMRSLKTIHAGGKSVHTGRSVMHGGSTSSSKMKPLG